MDSRVLKSEATAMPADDSMNDDELMLLLSASNNDVDTALQLQNLGSVDEDKKCAGVGQFVSISYVFEYHKNTHI